MAFDVLYTWLYAGRVQNAAIYTKGKHARRRLVVARLQDGRLPAYLEAARSRFSSNQDGLRLLACSTKFHVQRAVR